MQCNNCGGEIKAGERFCSYCGVERREEADKRHKSRLEAAVAKLSALTHLPQKAALIAVRIVFWVVAAALAGGILFTAGAVVVSSVASTGEVKRYERQIEAMQTYYDAGQYAELAEYYRKAKDVWKDGYELFEAVSRMEDDYESFLSSYATWKEVRDSGTENAREQAGYRQESCLLDAAFLLETIENEEAEAKEASLYYREELEKVLFEEFYMTEEEMNRLPEAAEDYDTFLELIQPIKERQ